jgi:hypothetical protein
VCGPVGGICSEVYVLRLPTQQLCVLDRDGGLSDSSHASRPLPRTDDPHRTIAALSCGYTELLIFTNWPSWAKSRHTGVKWCRSSR